MSGVELLGGAELHGGGRATLRLVRELDHSVAAVWTALTTPETTRRWWAQLRADVRPGGRFDLRWLNGEPEDLEWWSGTVTELDPPRLLEHTNAEHGLLRWELEPLDVGALRARTRLTLTDELEGDDAWVPLSLALWHRHLEELGAALDGGAVDWSRWGGAGDVRVRALRDAYAAAL